jgi:3-oxoacyl-[acyl-carrier-protein] synthase II
MRWVSIPNLPPLQAGLIPEADVEKFDRRLDFRNMDRASRWATVAARLTVREARFPEKPAFLNELGFYLGLSGAPSWAENEYLTSFVTHHHQITQLMAFPYIVPGSVGGNVCRALSIAGHNLTLNAGPGAGLLGLGPALSALQNGHGEALLSGAVDELTERILTDQFMATGGLQEGWLPPGEGAVMFTLETESHLRERGGKPLAKVEGIAYGTEIEHRYHPDTDSRSLELVVQSALDQAGIPASAIGTWCASGPPARLRQIALQFCPAWMERRLDTAPYTGWLEGAQSLMDVAAALQLPDLGPILVLTSSPYGVNGAVVLKKIDRLA